MNKVAFYTLGCKVNQFETQAMVDLFKKKGYEVVDSDEKADVYIINTCTVTNMSDRKSRQFIRRAKRLNKDSIVGVVGCYPQVAPEKVLEIEDVDLIIGTQDKSRIVELCEEAKEKNERINTVEDIMQIKEYEELSIEDVKGKTRAFIKIQEGCNQYCSYCIIPYARGPIRSRKLENVIKEVKKLADKGFKEIVLTGIHVASYGKDIGNVSLIDVIEKIHEIEGIERIRLSSLEPTIVTEEFMKRIVKLPKLCNHFHLSLQSGSNSVLKRMNRKYTTEQYKDIVNLIRKYMPDVGITTDIIVGFPGETDKEFQETYDFVKEIGFSRIHVFKYSPRKGTPAAKFKGQISGEVKSERSKRLIELGRRLTKEFNERFVGRITDVLFEEQVNSKEGTIGGYTTNYINVIAKGDVKLEGKILPVKIEKVQKGSLLGKIQK
ncbi:tRNA (N(6)-L-threonylcarbamoyladenosine(37)-C(2))-methylthiotransferase MtaB [Caldisalinibacter kiritimatiensis]|uniref:Threonylcarbamoyladenosine tRNA methylthiotransferase MtaB n=1 Tax=Caldisalinibacter kiritimatiensis TaxID=1304284 RepID=R1AUG1_9FIRM|nr:tRNA (N(6)-L-threonylcarbamoyladenosine(37)-C(2))-methylthiotransferase MtaB [Caldisalinibacter kiritimatiensis]EOD00803.1 MiaB family protein, possibly involved in tRNA or rRNA modification [Caldisalinibacter kiritimatiensis]